MIAVDTNVLVYAHRRDSTWHEAAVGVLRALGEGTRAWAIPWPCVHEFLAVVTHPRIYDPPSTAGQAIDQVDAWLESPRVLLLAESPGHWRGLRDILRATKVVGPQVHDARVAALCRSHGVTELWTADRDFSRFRGLKLRNPLVS